MPIQLVPGAVNVLRNYNAANKIPTLNGISRVNNNLIGKPSTPTFGQKLGKIANVVGNKIGDLVSSIGETLGPMGIIQVLGDTIKSGQSQFDTQGFNDSLADANEDFLNATSSASNTSDLLGLSDMRNDIFGNLNETINNQDYKWDGNLLGLFGVPFGAAATERDKQSARNALASATDAYSRGLNNAVNRVGNISYRNNMLNYFNNAAFGGPLNTHGADFSDDIIRVDTGGSHESNPLGGVPAGVDPMGIPNLVEEGERIWDDYVFSDRLKMPKSLVNKYKLGGRKNKSMTFAEGVDKISEKLGTELRPNDPITKRTKDAILSEFEDVQEEKRIAQEKKDMIKAMSEMSPEEFESLFMQNPIPTVPQQEAMPDVNNMPPQGMNEETEPLMQEQAGFEPQGLQGFAFGGRILDGEHGTSTRYVKRDNKYYRVIPRSDTSGSTTWNELEEVDPSLFTGSLEGASLRSLPGITVEDWSKYNDNVHIIKDKSGNYWVDNRNVGKNYNAARRAANQMVQARANLPERLDSAVITGDALEGMLNRNVREAQAQADNITRGYTPRFTYFGDTDEPFGSSVFGGSRGAHIFHEFKEMGLPYGAGVSTGGGSRGNFEQYSDIIGEAVVPGFGGRYKTVITDEHGPFLPNKDQKKPQSSITRGGTSGTRTVRAESGTKSPVKAEEWTPNKIFSVSSISPVDQWRKRSIMFNPQTPRTAIQKAVEGTTESDPENTTSAGAQQFRTLPTWMRYAPVVGGGLAVLSDIFGNPDYSGAENLLSASRRLSNPVNIPVTTIGNRIRRNPYDERLMVNRANQNLLAGMRSTIDNAGGNRAYRQFANNLMAYNNQAQLSDIDRNAYLANRQDALQTADFNRATDLYNMQAINQRNLAQAQLNNNRQMQGFNARLHAQNYLDSLRRQDDQLASADFTGLMQSLGNIGNENEQRNWLTGLAKQGVLNFMLGNSGDIDFVPSRAKNGGKIKSKKRRF